MPKHFNRTCHNCGKKYQRDLNWTKSKKTFCSQKCYGEWQRNKSFSEQEKPARPKRICSVVGCNNIHFGRGFCRKHYLDWYNESKGTKTHAKKNIIKKCLYCGVQFNTNRKKARFCSRKCFWLYNAKPFIIKKGYKKILMPNHHRSDGKGYVFEHIVIAESKIGRRLKEKEVVHHIDGNKKNNDPSNIQIFKNNSEHMKFHHSPQE